MTANNLIFSLSRLRPALLNNLRLQPKDPLLFALAACVRMAVIAVGRLRSRAQQTLNKTQHVSSKSLTCPLRPQLPTSIRPRSRFACFHVSLLSVLIVRRKRLGCAALCSEMHVSEVEDFRRSFELARRGRSTREARCTSDTHQAERRTEDEAAQQIYLDLSRIADPSLLFADSARFFWPPLDLLFLHRQARHLVLLWVSPPLRSRLGLPRSPSSPQVVCGKR